MKQTTYWHGICVNGSGGLTNFFLYVLYQIWNTYVDKEECVQNDYKKSKTNKCRKYCETSHNGRHIAAPCVNSEKPKYKIKNRIILKKIK
jgi:hypothetical protein